MQWRWKWTVLGAAALAAVGCAPHRSLPPSGPWTLHVNLRGKIEDTLSCSGLRPGVEQVCTLNPNGQGDERAARVIVVDATEQQTYRSLSFAKIVPPEMAASSQFVLNNYVQLDDTHGAWITFLSAARGVGPGARAMLPYCIAHLLGLPVATRPDLETLASVATKDAQAIYPLVSRWTVEQISLGGTDTRLSIRGSDRSTEFQIGDGCTLEETPKGS